VQRTSAAPSAPGALVTALARAAALPAAWAQAQRGQRLGWLTVALGTGIGLYFALPVEPSRAAFWALAGGAAGLGALGWGLRAGAGLVPLILAALLAGVVLGQVRAASVAGPVLPYRYYGPVEGRIVKVDRSGSGAVRVTLDRVRLDRHAPHETPRRVRLSLHGPQGWVDPMPGQRVMTTGHLTPPSGPAEPGGFDFQRHAWFLKLGAVGYARAPLLLAAEEEDRPRIDHLRATLSHALIARMPGEPGGIAAAITTGDRSGLMPDTVEALRQSNLAHLLAISGLHMGLVTGLVFAFVRGGLALIPAVALRHDIRRWAAACALPAAAFYLALSGGTVATQRAFVMAAVVMGAVLLGRRALTLRSVALAALIVLLWRPEALVGPGFQMSFAATAALIVAFRAWSDRGPTLPGWARAPVSLVIASAVAGAATAPFAAIHFNLASLYGLLANMLAVPAMGGWVMPALLIAGALAPLGLEGPALAVAALGIEWIVGVARWVSALPGAVAGIPAPGPAVLPLLGLGMALLVLRGAAARGPGAALCVVALTLWQTGERPAVLIADTGGLVGTLGPQGRALDRPGGDGFAARSWLENDGDLASQDAAADRTAAPDPRLPRIVAARGRDGRRIAAEACRDGAWIVTTLDRVQVEGDCRLLDPTALRTTGALALHLTDQGYAVRSSADAQGRRPWSGYR
jgi:competence protein ComEC